MTTATNANKATEILCRFDPSANKPVVFVTNNMDGNNIEAWAGGDAVMQPLSYYHTTQPLSAKDEKILRDRYAAHVSDPHVQIRHRLPRTNRVVPDRLPASKKATPAPAPAPTNVTPITAATSAPVVNIDPVLAEVAAAAQALKAAQERLAAAEAKAVAASAPAPVQTPAVEPITKAKRRTSRKTAAKKGGTRKPAAKPIESQPAPAPVANAPAEEPSIDQKFNALANMMITIAEKVGVELPSVK